MKQLEWLLGDSVPHYPHLYESSLSLDEQAFRLTFECVHSKQV